MASKRCGTCRETKPIEEFYSDSSRADGIEGCCKECRYIRVHTKPKEGFFRCTMCKTEKPHNEFYSNKSRKWFHDNKCISCMKDVSANNTIKRKTRILNHYGDSCACCGESAYEFLTVDHINNDGNTHRKEIGRGELYRWLIRNNFPTGFQVLCMNCNFAKGKYGICPHKKEQL